MLRVEFEMAGVNAAPLLIVSVLGLSVAACAGPARQPTNAAVLAPRASSGRDARLQSIAEDEARRVRAEWGAKRVAIVVLDPHNGSVLALSDDAPGEPVVPASTLKSITVALALDAQAINTEQRFDCGNGARAYGSQSLSDPGQHGSLNAAEILQVSSNIGTSRIFDALGAQRFNDGLRRFQLSAPSDITTGSLRGAIIANGEGSTLTPLALATAYGVFANDGLLVVPGQAEPTRVVQVATARTLRSMLEGVVTGEHATGKAAAVPGVRIGGKTGTSDPDPDCEACARSPGMFANFVGIVPLDEPRWVIYVGVGQPNKEGTGGTIAAPAFARVAARALAP